MDFMFRAEDRQCCQICGWWWSGSLVPSPTPHGMEVEASASLYKRSRFEKSPSSLRKICIKDSGKLLSKSLPKWLRIVPSFQEVSPDSPKVLTDDVAVICIHMSWGNEPHIRLETCPVHLFTNLVDSNLVWTYSEFYLSICFLCIMIRHRSCSCNTDTPLIPVSACSKVNHVCYFQEKIRVIIF